MTPEEAELAKLFTNVWRYKGGSDDIRSSLSYIWNALGKGVLV
jgi:hypothetical protein